jgi:YidC/Oxa1 family membrane protein insertase
VVPAANILQPLIDACGAILKFWHGVLGDFPGSWGVAIILMTFTVRLAILPLTFKGILAMQRLQRLQPEIKRIQERYKDDRQRMQEEMLRFYREQRVNPLGSCLPLLLQIPFFIALFYLLRSDEFRAEIRGNESFLFIPDLSDKLTDHPWVLALMIALYIGTQLGASAVTAVSADPAQKRIMYALPLVFAVFIVNFEAGLILYWVTTNVWTVGQQLLVRKLFPPPVPAATGVEAGAAAGSGASAPPPPPRARRKRRRQR